MAYSFVSRDDCPACGSAAVEALYCRNFAEEPIRGFIESYYHADPRLLAAGDYELVRCRACTLLFQRWVGDDALLAELYGVWLESDVPPEADYHYREAISAVAQSRDGHEIMAAAAHMKLSPADMTTLDFGMGWALWARIAQALGCRSYGNELSPARIEFARKHGITTVTDEEIGEARFHFINTEQVFEHVAKPGELARRLAAALKPGGILKISVPSGEGADRIVAALNAGAALSNEELMPVQPLEHVNCFTGRSIESLAGANGLRVVRPRLAHRYAFLRSAAAIPLSRPRQLAKELIRPVYQYHNKRNLYCWLQKVGA